MLEARGAAVAETLHYRCPAGAQDYIQVALTERIGRSAVNGNAFDQSVRCTGKPQAVTLYVSANGKAWRQGTAFNQATLTDGFGTGITDARTVTLS